MVLPENRSGRIVGAEVPWPAEVNALSRSPVAPKYEHRVRIARPSEVAMDDVHARHQFVIARPLLCGEAENSLALFLMTVPRPGVEVVSADTRGREKHGFGPVPVTVGFQPGVIKDRTQNSTRLELVSVAAADRITFLSQVGRRGSRNQGIEVGPLVPPGIEVNMQRCDVLRGE